MSEAERLSLDQRAEMGLAATDRLDPFALAKFLAIPVVSFDQCGKAARLDRKGLRSLATLNQRVYAVTSCSGWERTIIYNDRNAPTRQVSDVAHELSHTLLEHEPSPLAHADCYDSRDPRIEEEATYQAGALLIPREGALELLRLGMTEAEVAENYGVSLDMARWRCEATGARRQVARAQRLYPRRR